MAKYCRPVGSISKNQAQSEARELPTSGCTSVMEGPAMVLIVFIALYYTYTMDTISTIVGPSSHFRGHWLAVLSPQIGYDF